MKILELTDQDICGDLAHWSLATEINKAQKNLGKLSKTTQLIIIATDQTYKTRSARVYISCRI